MLPTEVYEALERLLAHDDWLQRGPEGHTPYFFLDAEYHTDLHTVAAYLGVVE